MTKGCGDATSLLVDVIHVGLYEFMLAKVLFWSGKAKLHAPL